MAAAITRLVVLYDETCPLCRRCHDWLQDQQMDVPLDFLAAGSPTAQALFGHLPLKQQLVVVADNGEVWIDGPAFIMCLWATKSWRNWSYRLSGPALEPIAKRFFHLVSSRRGKIGAFLGPTECDDDHCQL